MIDSTRREFLVQSAGALTVMALVPQLSRAAEKLTGPVNVAIIGAGRQGRAIIGELQKLEGVKIAAICDTLQSRLDASLRRVQGAEGFTDHKALLDKAKDATAIIIATPTHLHRQIAVDCLAAGRHVYCEAPLAHTVDDARAIAQAASKAGSQIVFQCGLEGRSNPVYKLARSFFRSDAVRDVVGMQAQSFQKTSWRFPAPEGMKDADANWRLNPDVSLGLAGEMGIHQFDVVNWYTDATPTSVTGIGSIRLHNDGRSLADTISLLVKYDNGAVLTYDASLANSYGGRFEVLRGTNAAVKLAWTHGWMFKEADAPTQGWEVYANRQQFHNDEGITLIADATKLASQGKLKEGVGLPQPPLYYAMADFVASVANAKPSACDAAAGFRSTVMAVAAAQAVAKGETVKIDPAMLKLGGA